ncbi:MAG: MEDS domain-containing protein [Thermoplasmata archaeon]
MFNTVLSLIEEYAMSGHGKSVEEVDDLEYLERADHLCCIYQGPEDGLFGINLFILNGLEKGERCVYIYDDREKEEIKNFFEGMGRSVDEFIEKGQLEFLSKEETFFKNGEFEPSGMIALIKRMEENALEEGFQGLRLTSEMTWALADRTGTGKLIEYETKLNKIIPQSGIKIMSQYNEKKFSPSVLVDVFYTHPKILLNDSIYGNPYYMPPEVFLSHLKGEIDSSHYENMKKNIVEKREMEKKKELASTSLETASIEVYWINPEGKIIYSNKSAKKRLRAFDQEESGVYIWDVDPNFSRDKREEFWKDLKEKRSNVFKTEHIDRDGKNYPVEVTSQYVKMGGDEFEFAFAKDISEREDFRIRLKEKKRQIETLLGNLPGMAYRSLNDREWTMEFVSDGCKKLTGYDPEALVSGEIIWRDVIHPADRERVWREVQKELENREHFKINYRIRTRGDSEKWVMSHGTGIYDDDGGLKYLEGIIEDISSEKKAKERTDFLNTLLRQDLQSKYQIIHGHLQLIDESKLPEDQRDFIEKAMDMSSEANSILTLAKTLEEIENTDWKIGKQVDNLIDESLEEIRDIIEREGVEVEKNGIDDRAEVRGDHSLNILISELLKTRMKTSRPQTFKIDVEEKDREVKLIFEDDGEVLPDDIKKLFSGDVYRGFTTGLEGVRYYIVKQIANHNSADIVCEDSELGGHMFEIYLQKP